MQTVRTIGCQKYANIKSKRILQKKKTGQNGRRIISAKPEVARRKEVFTVAKKLYRFINSKDKNDFLNYYISCGTISKAAKKAGISRQTHYDWLKNDKKGFYRKAFELADKMAADLLEEEAFRRAVEGDTQVVYYKGQEVGRKRVYSDQLLAILLKGTKPQYRENTEVNTTVNVDLSDAVTAVQQRLKKGTAEYGEE